jgi:hypothetical protein
MCCTVLALIFFSACEKFEEPATIYDPSLKPTTDAPTITQIVPAGVAAAGVSGREIKIFGTNLGVKNGSDTDWVYIGGVRTVIKEIVQGSMISVYRPQLAADRYDRSIILSVTALGAVDTSANASYMVESPGATLGDYAGVGGALMASDLDKQENLYIIAGRTVWRNTPAGVGLAQMLGTVNLPGDFRATTDAKFGPGDPGLNMYVAVGQSFLYSVRVDTADTRIRTVKGATLPAAVTKLDFDANGNIYTGGSAGVFLTNFAAGTVSQNLGYQGTVIRELRVYNGYIYVADSLNLWRSQIAADGTLGAQTSLVNLSSDPGFNGCAISSFTIDELGKLYLCLRHHPRYSVFVREDDGSITPFYFDENILPNTVEQLLWSNGRSLYLISKSLGGATAGTFASNRVFRMSMDRNGAPFEGRKYLK